MSGPGTIVQARVMAFNLVHWTESFIQSRHWDWMSGATQWTLRLLVWMGQHEHPQGLPGCESLNSQTLLPSVIGEVRGLCKGWLQTFVSEGPVCRTRLAFHLKISFPFHKRRLFAFSTWLLASEWTQDKAGEPGCTVTW